MLTTGYGEYTYEPVLDWAKRHGGGLRWLLSIWGRRGRTSCVTQPSAPTSRFVQ